MAAPINHSLRAALAGASFVLSVAGCQMQAPEPAHPKAGDVVPPRLASFASSREGTSTPSLYEYSDHKRYVTTGRRIRFHVDNAFVKSTNRSDGPKFNIGLHYDGRTLDRSTHETLGHVISATLESHAGGGNLTPENITRAEMSFGFFGLEPGNLSLRGRACGLDAYNVAQNDYTTRHIARYGLSPPAAAFRSRWGGSMLFALRNNRGVYSDVIACDQTKPTCTATTSYRAWPVRLTFPSHRICDYPKVVADARFMFDRFYLDQTERSRGQIERRWTPVSIRTAAS